VKTLTQYKALLGARRDGKPYKLNNARARRAIPLGTALNTAGLEKVRRDHAFDRRRVRSRGRMLTATGLPAFPR